jgi:hypothetical protein
VGHWDLRYDMLGNRLRQIGPFDLDYDRLGNRVRRIGPLTVSYDQLGNRPASVTVPDEQPLSDDLLVTLYLVLYFARQQRES